MKDLFLIIMNYWWVWPIIFISSICTLLLINFCIYTDKIKGPVWLCVSAVMISWFGSFMSGWLSIIAGVLWLIKFAKYNL